MDLDYAIALSLHSLNDFEDEVEKGNSRESDQSDLYSQGQRNKHVKSKPNSHSERNGMSIVDEAWELIDPNPDIHQLFLQFDKEYFWGKLKSVEVRWSPRMTLCAGVCCYEGRGGLCSIRLSLPLLKLRPRKDLVETLLHEMIHALLFVTQNNKDHDSHGPEFHKHMNRINKETGTNISVYHNFHDEVNEYRQHWWQCNGPCRARPPYYGIVRRAMNREPSPRDFWWAEHEKTCGGTYTKIKEPANYKRKGTKGGGDSNNTLVKSVENTVGEKRGTVGDQNSISKWFKKSDSSNGSRASNGNPRFPGKGNVLGSAQPFVSRKLLSPSKNRLDSDIGVFTERHPRLPLSNGISINQSERSEIGFSSTSSVTTINDLECGSKLCNSKASTSSSLSENTETLVKVTHAGKGQSRGVNSIDLSCSRPSSDYNVNAKEKTNGENRNEAERGNQKRHFFQNDSPSSPSSGGSKLALSSDRPSSQPLGISCISGEIMQENLVECPSCPRKVPADAINAHLDKCLSFGV